MCTSAGASVSSVLMLLALFFKSFYVITCVCLLGLNFRSFRFAQFQFSFALSIAVIFMYHRNCGGINWRWVSERERFKKFWQTKWIFLRKKNKNRKQFNSDFFFEYFVFLLITLYDVLCFYKREKKKKIPECALIINIHSRVFLVCFSWFNSRRYIWKYEMRDRKARERERES